MKKKIEKQLVIFLVLIVSVIFLVSVGYAQIANIGLTIDGSASNNNMYYITNGGLTAYNRVNQNSSYNNYRPCVYLVDGVQVAGGEGSSTSPYTLLPITS